MGVTGDWNYGNSHHFYHFGRRWLANHGFPPFPVDATADPLYS
jgi:hypothetical protein